MAKEYGVPVRPEASVEMRLNELADHLNWSKGDVLRHAVNSMYDDLMSLPRAVRPL